MQFSLGLLIVSVAAVVAVLVIGSTRAGTRGPWALFTRFALASAVSAAASTAMYVLHERGGVGSVALAVADTAMVLAPGFLVLALAALDRRALVALAVFVAASGTIMAVSTSVVPKPGSLAIKAALLAIGCGCAAVLALRSRWHTAAGMRAIAAATGVYAVYSVARVAVTVVAHQTAVFDTAFSMVPTTILGGLCVGVIGLSSAGLLATQRVRVPSESAVADSVISLRLTLDPAAQASSWHERAHSAMVDELREACSALGRATAIPEGAVLHTPLLQSVTVDDVIRVLRTTRGWTKAEAAAIRSDETRESPQSAAPMRRRHGGQ